MNEQHKETLGQYLKRERKMRDITVENIFEATRINLSYLHALENDNYDELPQKSFLIGFLRCYAEYVGIDENEVINRFLASFQDASRKDKTSESISEKKSDKKTYSRILPYVLVFTAVSIIIALLLSIF